MAGTWLKRGAGLKKENKISRNGSKLQYVELGYFTLFNGY